MPYLAYQSTRCTKPFLLPNVPAAASYRSPKTTRLGTRGSELMRWVGFALAIPFGLFLYWCRCRRRVWYGVGQIIVALALIALAFFPNWPNLLWSGWAGPAWGEQLPRLVALIGGLYALVRGLDNIDGHEKWNQLLRSRRG